MDVIEILAVIGELCAIEVDFVNEIDMRDYCMIYRIQ
jgi:hypothetical protein